MDRIESDVAPVRGTSPSDRPTGPPSSGLGTGGLGSHSVLCAALIPPLWTTRPPRGLTLGRAFPRGAAWICSNRCAPHTVQLLVRVAALFATRRSSHLAPRSDPPVGPRLASARRPHVGPRNGDQADLAANPYPERGRPSHLPISRLDHPTVSTLRTRWTGLERVSLWPSRGPTLMAPARAVQGTPRNCLVARPRVLGPCQRCRSSPRQTAPRPMPPAQWASGTTSRGERAAAWMLPRRCW